MRSTCSTILQGSSGQSSVETVAHFSRQCTPLLEAAAGRRSSEDLRSGTIEIGVNMTQFSNLLLIHQQIPPLGPLFYAFLLSFLPFLTHFSQPNRQMGLKYGDPTDRTLNAAGGCS
jgi:hypothetical protein